METCIFVVDDNSTNLYMLESMLKGYGMKVISAENGKEALIKARLNPPDLIVTDILMPVMDGYTLCREWKTDDKLKNIPFIFFTATYTEPKDEAFALSLGADRFVIKPLEPEVLMKIIKEVLVEKYKVKQFNTKPLGEEMEFFRQHNEILFRKLEKKMQDLEIANQRLKLLEEMYRLSFENASDLIYSIDTDLNILSVTPSIEKLLGYKPQDFIGRRFSDLDNILAPETLKEALASISLILKGGIKQTKIYQLIAKDGSIKQVEANGSGIIRDNKIIGMISIVRDITERKLVEDKIKKLNSELEERVIKRTEDLAAANKELEAFSYSVSHDLRAPLRAISGFSNLLTENYSDKLDNNALKYFNIIKTNIQKMDALITDLLELSKVTRFEISFTKIDFNSMVNSVYNEITSPETKDSFIFEVKSLPDIIADPHLMQQVWVNLLSNALKYTMKSYSKRIEVGGYIEGDNNIYYVKDTGAGFNPDYKNKLFGVFQRLHSTEEFEGIGIGLAIVQRIIHRHKGKVWAEGEINKGATFYFSLPNKVPSKTAG